MMTIAVSAFTYPGTRPGYRRAYSSAKMRRNTGAGPSEFTLLGFPCAGCTLPSATDDAQSCSWSCSASEGASEGAELVAGASEGAELVAGASEGAELVAGASKGAELVAGASEGAELVAGASKGAESFAAPGIAHVGITIGCAGETAPCKGSFGGK